MSRSSSRACSRWRRASTSRGISAAAFVGAVPVLQSYGYAHVGADVTGFIDLYKGNRVLMVRGTFEGVWRRWTPASACSDSA